MIVSSAGASAGDSCFGPELEKLRQGYERLSFREYEAERDRAYQALNAAPGVNKEQVSRSITSLYHEKVASKLIPGRTFVQVELDNGTIAEGLLLEGPSESGYRYHDQLRIQGAPSQRIREIKALHFRPVGQNEPRFVQSNSPEVLKGFLRDYPNGNNLVLVDQKRGVFFSTDRFSIESNGIRLKKDGTLVAFEGLSSGKYQVLIEKGSFNPERFGIPSAAQPIQAKAFRGNVSFDADLRVFVNQVGARKTVFGNKTFYDFFALHPERVREYLERWYLGRQIFDAKLSEKLLSALNRLEPQHRALLLDPRVIYHLERFDAFYSKLSAGDRRKSAFELRGLFRSTFPKITVFRGLMTPDPKQFIEEVLQKGLVAQSFRNPANDPQAYPRGRFEEVLMNSWFGKDSLAESPLSAIITHQNNTISTMLQSVSVYPEVAEMASWSDFYQRFEWGKFVLIKMNLNEFDLIRLDGPYASTKPKNWGPQSEYRHGGFSKRVFDRDFELLTEAIRPKDIKRKNIYVYENNPSGWSIK